MTRLVPVLAVCVAVTFGVLTTGCTSTIDGAAVKSQGSVPLDDVPPLEESALDGLMLSNKALDEIAGVELESFYSTDEMNDNADLVSDVGCLGAIYPGEDASYDGSGWSAVRDELLLEADAEEDAHLVEQTVVLFDTADEAAEFFDMSKESWNQCAKTEDITVEDGPWIPDDVQDVSERMISLKAEVSGTLEGICQHALGVVYNVIVEGFSCDVADNDDAQEIATQILEDAADQ
jgi:PknH-like extracellular domain